MAQHLVAHHTLSHVNRGHWRTAPDVLRFMNDRFLWLPLGALVALVWANTAAESYFRFAHALSFPVNEIGMALFMALLTQEAFETVMPGGVLHGARRWGTAVVAAVGGFAGAAVVYVGIISLQHEPVLARAWPIACAIDIGASYYLLRVIYGRSTVVSYLLILAFATDTLAMILLAAWTPLSSDHVRATPLLLAAIGLAGWLRYRRVHDFWPYLALCGPLSWAALYVAGVHPALALVPLVPFLPREPRTREPFADPGDDDRVHRAEHRWFEAVQLVLFLFGLVNAGVTLRGYDTGSWAIAAAAIVGRPLGILAAVSVAASIGWRLPRHVGWRDLAVVALATSSGFTLALFFASGLLPIGGVLQQIKVGALLTAGGAVLAVVAARLLRLGRFRRGSPR